MRCSSLSCACALLAVVLMSGCGDRRPATISSAAPVAAVVDGTPFALAGAVLNSKGERLTDVAISYSSSAPDVVSVTEAGECRCLRSGDAAVLLAGGGISALVGVKCRLVTSIEAPEALTFTLGRPAQGFHATAINEAGAPIPDVAVQVESSSPDVVRVEGDKLVPIVVGKATVRARVGQVTTQTEVTVVETALSQPLLLADGGKHACTLDTGTYEVEISVTPELNDRDGVTVSWQGSNCPDQPEKRKHRIRGHVTGSSVLVVSNPTAFGLGSSVTGMVTVTRVP